jgi:hypothetical protein
MFFMCVVRVLMCDVLGYMYDRTCGVGYCCEVLACLVRCHCYVERSKGEADVWV